MPIEVRTRIDEPTRYRSVGRTVGLSELDDFIRQAIANLSRDRPGGSPFAIFHGEVNDRTRSRVEVGVPASHGDRVLPGGSVVFARAGPGQTDYDPIHEFYGAVQRYIAERGLRPNGPTREVYVGAHDPLTEIEVVWPVESLEELAG